MSTKGPSASTTPAIPHSVLVKQKQGQAVLIWAVGSFCVFGWEWLLCLPQEYSRIWRTRPFTPISWLYLANRYFGLVQLCIVVSLVADAWGPGACKHVFYFEPVGALLSTVLSQMILGTRVFAIYNKSRIIGALLAFIIVGELVVGGISVSTTHPPPPSTAPAGQRPPCGAVMGPQSWLLTFWSIPLFYDALTFLLTAYKAYEYWRREVNTALFDIIWRDGVLYFFAIFSMNLVNIGILTSAPQGLRAVNLTPTLVFEVVLSCRLLLNLRGAGGTKSTTGSGLGSKGIQYNYKPGGTTNNDSATQVGHWSKSRERKVLPQDSTDVVDISAISPLPISPHSHPYAVSESPHLPHSPLPHSLSHKTSVDPGTPLDTSQTKLNSVPSLVNKLEPNRYRPAVNEGLGRGGDFLDMGARSGSPWQAVSPV